jgi:uncharacterized protein YukE
MSRSPAHLAAAAVALRALATALDADFEGLSRHSGPATWEGPAASAHRTRAAAATGDARAVVAELGRLADRLEERAADVAAAEEAADRRLRERTDG